MALYKNLSAVSHDSTNIVEVTGLEIEESGDEITSSADADTFIDFADVVRRRVTASVFTKDFGVAVDTFLLGAVGTLAATVNSVTGSGHKTIALSNARLMSMSANPKHADVECNGVLRYLAYSSDGTTSPLAIS